MFALRFLVIVSKSERDRYSLKCVEYIECVCVCVCVYHVVPPCWHDMIPWPFLCLVVVVGLKWFVIYLNFDWQIAQRCAAPGGAIWPGRDAHVAGEGVSGGAPEMLKLHFDVYRIRCDIRWIATTSHNFLLYGPILIQILSAALTDDDGGWWPPEMMMM